jgi:hypothetical protein
VVSSADILNADLLVVDDKEANLPGSRDLQLYQFVFSPFGIAE